MGSGWGPYGFDDAGKLARFFRPSPLLRAVAMDATLEDESWCDAPSFNGTLYATASASVPHSSAAA